MEMPAHFAPNRCPYSENEPAGLPAPSRPTGWREMTDMDSFAAWMQRLRAGEDDAAREVFERFARRLVLLARARFDKQLAHRVDPEDVVQSAFKSFFIRQREGNFQFGDWDRSEERRVGKEWRCRGER